MIRSSPPPDSGEGAELGHGDGALYRGQRARGGAHQDAGGGQERCDELVGALEILAWALTVVRSSRMGLLVLALVIGAGAGAAAIGFRWLITTFALALSGHADYAGLGPVANPHVPGLGRWFVLFTPVVAELLYGS